MDVQSILQRSQRVPSTDSASKVLEYMQKCEKMLKLGHGLSVDTSIQSRLTNSPGPTALYSNPSFSLYKLADRRPNPEPRGALFDICTENFHYALPVDAVMAGLDAGDVGHLLSEPAVAAVPDIPPSAPPVVPSTEAQPPDTQAKPSKPKEKKEKKEKEKKEKKDKKEKREKKDKREKGDKKEKKDKKRKRPAEATDPG